VAVDNCKRMGIKIMPPDINKSSSDFEIEECPESLQGLGIRFGMTGIKNIGEAAIEHILKARKRVKTFQSFTHFLLETEKSKVNKKTLEALIKVGAFSEFTNRSSLLENLAQIRDSVGKISSVEGQDDLFAEVETVEITDNFPVLEEYPQQELLSFEKELLGFYLTAHPLATALEVVKQQANKKISDLDINLDIGNTYTFGGLINQFRKIITKKGQEMGFGQFEDGTGSIEFVVFPKTYAKGSSLFEVDSVINLRAKVEQKDGTLNLVVERAGQPAAHTLSQAELEVAHKIFIPRSTPRENLLKIGEFLKNSPGSDKVLIAISTPTGIENKVLPYTVGWCEDLEQKINSLIESKK